MKSFAFTVELQTIEERIMRIFATTFIAMLLLANPAFAASHKAAGREGSLVVQNIAEQEVEVKRPDGSVETRRVPVTKAVPGAEVIYTTRFTNIGKEPAENIVINNPIPKNTEYVADSAFGKNTTITFSVDGKSFATPDRLIVKTPEGRERPALASEYTHIRWTFQERLLPQQSGEVGFRVKIK